MKEDCRYAVQLDTLTNKLNKIQTKSERLNAILAEIQYYKPEMKIQPRTMQKRRVPTRRKMNLLKIQIQIC